MNRLAVFENYLSVGRINEDLDNMTYDAFDRYDNPFEQKYTLHKDRFTPAIEDAIRELEVIARMRAASLFSVELFTDELRHYCGVFQYDGEDRLAAHVDAGIHPIDGRRKHATALLYLSDLTPWDGGQLEFFAGDACVDPEPQLYTSTVSITPSAGTLVLFENNDYAWHGVCEYHGKQPRRVITVSYLSKVDYAPGFLNQRQRAYFIPRPGEVWTPELYKLRDKRADPERYAEVYRVSTNS